MLPRLSSNYAKIFLAFFAYSMSVFNRVCIKESRHLDLNEAVILGTVTLLSSLTHMGKKSATIPFLRPHKIHFYIHS